MSTALPELSAEQRTDLLSILRSATDLIPAADAGVRASATSTDTKLAREMHDLAVAFNQLYDRAKALSLPSDLKTKVTGLLDYHRELVGQAPQFAFRPVGNRNARQRALLADGLGTPALELEKLRDELMSQQ